MRQPLELVSKRAGTYDPLDLLSVEELAGLWKLNPKTIRRWISEGELESVLLGSRRRIPRAAAEAYQRRHRNGRASAA